MDLYPVLIVHLHSTGGLQPPCKFQPVTNSRRQTSMDPLLVSVSLGGHGAWSMEHGIWQAMAADMDGYHVSIVIILPLILLGQLPACVTYDRLINSYCSRRTRRPSQVSPRGVPPKWRSLGSASRSHETWTSPTSSHLARPLSSAATTFPVPSQSQPIRP